MLNASSPGSVGHRSGSLVMGIMVLLIASVFVSGIYFTLQNQNSDPSKHHSTTTSTTSVESSLSAFTNETTLTTTTASTSTTSVTTSTTTTTSLATDWLTYHYDNARTGSTSSFPNISNLSLSWKSEVDAAVYAEPLFYNGYTYVVTENDTVYALNSANGAIVWSVHLGSPANSLVAPYVCSGHGPDIIPTIGVTGTPVIDSSTNTIYVAALIENVGYKLFALNTSTGEERWNSTITAPNFNYLPEEQRGALALGNGFVYVPFGGYSWSCFNPGPTGWVIAMSLNGSGEQYAFNVPTKMEGDIWTPEGVSIDSSGDVTQL